MPRKGATQKGAREKDELSKGASWKAMMDRVAAGGGRTPGDSGRGRGGKGGAPTRPLPPPPPGPAPPPPQHTARLTPPPPISPGTPPAPHRNRLHRRRNRRRR